MEAPQAREEVPTGCCYQQERAISVAMAATSEGCVHWDIDCVYDGNSDSYFLALFFLFSSAF